MGLEKRSMPDAAAVRAVISAVADGQRADALDMATALIVMQAVRLETDLLEPDVLDAAEASGVAAESVAAVLDLPGAEAAAARRAMLAARRAVPRALSEQPQPGPATGWRGSADRAGRPATHEAGPARVKARDAAGRVALGLLRAAETLDRCAARCGEWEGQAGSASRHQDLRRRAREYAQAARTYREMADRFHAIGEHLS